MTTPPRILCLLVKLAIITSAKELASAPLQWQEGPGFRSAPLEVRASRPSAFSAINTEQAGLLWTNTITPEAVAKNYNMVSGAGVAAGDFDGDGLCDLYFCNRGGPDALFQNKGGWSFTNATAAAGIVGGGRSSTGAVFADLNGDGRLDLLVNSFFGPNSCWINLGEARFTNHTASAGLSPKGGATSMALGDLDADGDLDLYTAYFGIEALLREGGRFSFTTVNGKPVVTGRHARRLRVVDGQLIELGEQDVLYWNDGSARFTPAEWKDTFKDEIGLPVTSTPLDFGLAVQIRDTNADGLPDIFVCNDFQTPDRFWLNRGKGTFSAIPSLALRNMSYASMGVDFADIDRDGDFDFITVDMLSRSHSDRLRQMNSMPPVARSPGAGEEQEAVPRNALYLNRGDGSYAEIAFLSGLAASDWSWTPIFLDVDLDGFEDLLISTGSLYDVMDRDTAESARSASRNPRDALAAYPRLESRNAVFRNNGGLTFEDASKAWGFDSTQISFGMALADLDNDGDMDVAINCANTAPLLYRNESSALRVAVRLKGNPPNTEGIGALITLTGGAVPIQQQEIISGGRYLSGDQAMRVFAAGRSENMKLQVAWPSGRRSLITGVKANRLYEIHEPDLSP